MAGEKILLLEDDPAVVNSFKKYFGYPYNTNGYTPLFASTVQEFWTHDRLNRPDYMIIDSDIPLVKHGMPIQGAGTRIAKAVNYNGNLVGLHMDYNTPGLKECTDNGCIHMPKSNDRKNLDYWVHKNIDLYMNAVGQLKNQKI